MLKINTVCLVLSIIIGSLFTSCVENEESKTQVFYLVRHAEKELSDPSDNPPLTMQGEERAESLVDVLDDVALDQIFSTSYDRNMNTVNPVANEQDLAVQNYDWHDWQPMLDKMLQSNDSLFLICGHGDNLLPMIEYLGGEKPMESLGKHEYDNVFKVTKTEGEVTVEVIKF